LWRYHINVDEVLCKQNRSETPDHGSVHHCAIVYEQDVDFWYVNTVDPSKSPDQLLPSQKIDPAKLSHLTELLDELPQCFSDNPGFCNVVQHEIHVTSDFKLKRLRAYQVPQSIKPEIERQIRNMLNLGIIKPSKSEMASPIVCVLKGRHGKDGIRIAVDYRYLNSE